MLKLLTDKYFDKYNKIFNYNYNNYTIVCKYLLFLYSFKGTNICDFEYYNYNNNINEIINTIGNLEKTKLEILHLIIHHLYLQIIYKIIISHY